MRDHLKHTHAYVCAYLNYLYIYNVYILNSFWSVWALQSFLISLLIMSNLKFLLCLFVCFSILNSINININFEVILVSESVVKLVIIASNLDEFFHAAHFTVEKGGSRSDVVVVLKTWEITEWIMMLQKEEMEDHHCLRPTPMLPSRDTSTTEVLTSALSNATTNQRIIHVFCLLGLRFTLSSSLLKALSIKHRYTSVLLMLQGFISHCDLLQDSLNKIVLIPTLGSLC